MYKRGTETEFHVERASTKPKLEHKDPPAFDASTLSIWLDDWMKSHLTSKLHEDLNILSLINDFNQTIDLSTDESLEEFLEDLKSDHNITIQHKKEFKDKFLDVQLDYLHCSALNNFISQQFKVNFKNRKRVSQFQERMEESADVEMLQFDVLYDFSMYIGNCGVQDSDESDNEEPVEEDDDDEDEDEDGSEDEDASNESCGESGGSESSEEESGESVGSESKSESEED